ncbi:MAG: phosphotransferase [Deltaproteobacteria bacterium]|nr:phosphotransferase [Deltaproteobacteria bacterium]
MEGPAARDAALEATLERVVRENLGRGVARIDWIEGQLALRRFARVHLEAGPPATLVARIDAPEDPAGRPPGVPPEPALEPIRARLEAAGLPVPARLGGDAAAGVDLLEDLGDLLLRDAAQSTPPDALRGLYEEACDLVPRLQRVVDGDVEAFRRRLDDALIAYKAELFARYGLAARGHEARPAEVAAVRDAFARIGRVVAQAPARLAHRDFQSTNLLVRASRPPGARIAMIDLQGAFLAPPEYDLVCLLRDSYVELDEAELAYQLGRIRPQLPDAPDAESFAQRFDLLTLTRKGKDCARFLYAAQERGDRRFLRYLPASVRALRRAARGAAARDAALAPLAELIFQLPEDPCAA